MALKVMKKVLHYVFGTILLCGCAQSNKSKESATVTNEMWQFDDQEVATWEQWFETNSKGYVYLSFGNDSVSPSHNDAIDELISLFYNGNDTLRHDYRMILWRLNKFYPINNDNVDGYERYLGVEKQIDSLLNFKTNFDYLVRRKSALKRLMYEFRIRMYEDKLASSLPDKVASELFEQERKAWSEYQDTTSDAFGINVLRKESYYLKYVFWNNYDFDIMDHRLKSLLYMYYRESSIFAETEMGDWDKVKLAYRNLKEQLNPNENPDYDYSYEEKIKALTDDEEAFEKFMRVHTDLLKRLKVCDVNYLLHLKERTLVNFYQYDRMPRFDAANR